METVLVAHSRDGLGGSVITGALLAKALGPGQWWPRERIAEAGLPTVFARVARAAMAPRGEDGINE